MPTIGEYRFDELLAATAAKSPTPGGGAIAAATGAMACALAGMVVSYSVGRKDLAAHQERLTAIQKTLEDWRAEFLVLADADAVAYGTLNALQKLPPSDASRIEQLPKAIDDAIAVPVRCLKLSADVAKQVIELLPITNKYLKSDLAIAAVLADAAARSSLCNVRINLSLLEESGRRMTMERQCAGLAQQAAELAAKTVAACA